MDSQKHRKGQQSDNHHFLTVCGKQQLVAEPHSLGDVIATLMTQHLVGYFTPMLRQGKSHLLDLSWGSRSTFGPTYL